MTTASKINEYIDRIAPYDTAMGFDNPGLLVGDPDASVKKALVALDITTDVVKEAKSVGAELIISHHPVIFQPLKRLLKDSVPFQLAAAGITAICAHTNLDMAKGGVNDTLARLLEVADTAPLSVHLSKDYTKIVVFTPETHTEAVRLAMIKAGAGTLNDYSGCAFVSKGTGSFTPQDGAKPFLGEQGREEQVPEEKVEMICPPSLLGGVLLAMKQVHPYEEPAFDLFSTRAVKEVVPMGLVGSLGEELDPEQFARLVKARLSCEGVRYVRGNRPVKKVALCGGAGGDLINAAAEKGADAYVTGEIKHHELLFAREKGITVVDAGHFKTEDIIVPALINRLQQEFRDITFIRSSSGTDGVRYL